MKLEAEVMLRLVEAGKKREELRKDTTDPVVLEYIDKRIDAHIAALAWVLEITNDEALRISAGRNPRKHVSVAP